MNTAIGYIRVNLTLPKDIIAYLKRHTANMSQYISEAVGERIAHEKRMRALETLRKHGPAFPHIKDASAYVHDLRGEDEERAERLGI